MRAILICGIFSAALLGVLGLEPNFNPTTSTSSGYYTNYQPFGAPVPCNHEVSDEVYWGYRHAFYSMSAILYPRIAVMTGAHFVYSPHTSYLTLAVIAEGTTGQTRQQMFKFLSLPDDICLREAYYHFAFTREHIDHDVVFARNRLFVADSSIQVNPNWREYAKTYANLNTISVPYKKNPAVEIEALRKLFNAQLPNLNLNGNSFLLESLDYNALWTSVFSDAVFEEGPFYNSFGEQIGVLEYMKVTKRATIGVIPSLNMKVIDLPVGREGRFRMYFVTQMSPREDFEKIVSRIESSIIFESVANMKRSFEPVEIVIPKMKITSEIDMRKLLEDVGIQSLWTDPLATRNISEPAALPSAFIQRVTVTIDEGGVRPAVPEYLNFVPPLHNPGHSSYSSSAPLSAVEHNPLELSSFVANKPFLFGLFDAQSLIGLMTGIFSKVQH